VRLLDTIEDENGPVMADLTLAYLRRIMNWHAGRSDDFRSPIVRGMARTKPSERRRQRTLTDVELRAVWRAAEAHPSVFGRLLQFLLLTAVRRNEGARMRRTEVSGDEWTIPAARLKTGKATGDLIIPLSAAARDILGKLPVIGSNEFVFTLDGRHPLVGFARFKSKFDAVCGVTGWSCTTCDAPRVR
jgi:integrase